MNTMIATNNEDADFTFLEGEYACFVIAGEEYAIRTAYIDGVIDTPVIRRVPKTPSFVAGVSNIRGRIVPILDPAVRFDLASSVPKSTILVRFEHSLYGILIDQTGFILKLSDEMVEPVNPIMIKREAPFIHAMAKIHDRLIYLLDIDAFINAGLTIERKAEKTYDQFIEATSESLKLHNQENLQKFLCLKIGKEEYGIDLSCLVKVVSITTMKQKKRGPVWVAGIVENQGQKLPVINLIKKYALEPVAYNDDACIAIVNAGAVNFGILANSFSKILKLTDDEIKEPPAAAMEGKSSHIRGIGLQNNGERLTIIMDETQLLNKKEATKLSDLDQIRMAKEKKGIKAAGGKTDHVLISFRVADIEFTFDMKEVMEIINYTKPCKIPKAAPFIRGIISIRGEIVTLVDLRKRLDIDPDHAIGQAIDHSIIENRVIIVKRKGSSYGIIADTVQDILRISKKEIDPAPKILKGVNTKFIGGIIKIAKDDRTPILLNMEKILG